MNKHEFSFKKITNINNTTNINIITNINKHKYIPVQMNYF